MEKILKPFLLALCLIFLAVGCSSDDDGTGNLPEALYWKEVYPGWQQTIAKRSDGTLWSWGMNVWGQLGNGEHGIDAAHVLTPAQISTDTDWMNMAHGSIHTLAIKSNGTLWAWGFNMYGQLGINSIYDKSIPVQVGNASNWIDVACSIKHSIGLKSDATLWTWGDNVHGEIGDGTTEIRPVPTQIGGNDWVAIKAGTASSIAMKSNGSIWGWGAINNESQLTPIQIAPAGSWEQISGGWANTLAIKTDGSLWAIGVGNQMGLGNYGPYLNFTQVGTGNNWATVSTGEYNTIALKTDGTLWTWGGNNYGQLGNGTTDIHTNTPGQIGIGSTWEYIAEESSADHTFARKTDKTLWGFGWNHAGQLGNGTQIDSNVPVLIPCPQ